MVYDIFGLIYAILVLVGGVFGFIKADSYVSLFAGITCGLIAGYGAFTLNYYCLLGTGVVLGGVMIVRFIDSGKFMPAGLIALLSIFLILRCIVYFIKKD